MESNHRWIEHTAELQLEIHARSEAGVFRQAVEALRELLEDDQPARGDRAERTVEAEATDRGALLAEWLAELVFLAESDGLVPEEVRDLVVGEDSVTATAGAGTSSSMSNRGASAPVRVDDTLWEIPAYAREDMRVPARVFADEDLLEAILTDRSLEQLQNVATLPGIVEAAIAMPDIHQGYGFPVGGLAATAAPDGVVSPGGVGYDINCGVRLLAAPFTAGELGARKETLVHEISRSAPAGAGREGGLRVRGSELDRVLC